MPILIDSDILIEVSRGWDTAIVDAWRSLSESDVVLMCSPVSIAKLWRGARASEHATLNALFSALVCVPVDREIGRTAGEYLNRYARSHSVELGDALVAATASVTGAELWTRNRKHYPMKEVRFR